MFSKRHPINLYTVAAFLLAFSFSLLSCGSNDSKPADKWDHRDMKVMSFNIMCSFCGNDKGNDPWQARVNYFADIFKRHAPDLAGLQELTFAKEINDQILPLIDGYKAIYARDLEPEETTSWTDYPDATIVYLASRFEPLETGWYWNSETPDTAWASGWSENGSLWRIVVWTRFKQISDGREFIFATTHFDNNQPNQPHSAVLAINRFKAMAETYPVIFVGDYNSKPGVEAYATLATGIGGTGFHFLNAYDLAGSTFLQVTNLNPKPAYDPASRIDHIWLAGTAQWGAAEWTVDMTGYGEHNYYPSDHFPILSVIKW